MCGPMRGAVLGAVVLEGWADSVEAAERLVASGAIDLEPCHHQAAVGPMAGIISPSMPLFVVENRATGRRAYSNFNEGLGKVLRFGANGPEVIARLRTMAGVVAPTLAAMIKQAHGFKYHWALADYLQRSARHIASRVDLEQAYAVGRAAVELAVAGLFVYAPPFQALLHTAPPEPWMLLMVAPFPFVVWGSDELRRLVLRRRGKPATPPRAHADAARRSEP